MRADIITSLEKTIHRQNMQRFVQTRFVPTKLFYSGLKIGLVGERAYAFDFFSTAPLSTQVGRLYLFESRLGARKRKSIWKGRERETSQQKTDILTGGNDSRGQSTQIYGDVRYTGM